MNARILGSLVAFALVACGTSPGASTTSQAPTPTPEPSVEEPAPAAPAEEEPYELFGEKLNTNIQSVNYADILAAPDKFDGKELITNGTVRASCTKRGCWMEVRPDEARDGAAATIRFLDYGFFVPLDSRSARVKFQGTVEVSVLTKAQVAEFESEGGTVLDKHPDGSAKALLIIASGVEMRGRKSKK